MGKRPSQFRRLTEAEGQDLVREIKDSGARITWLVLLSTSRVWAFEFKDQLKMPVLAVGAAFAFHAGQLAQAPHRAGCKIAVWSGSIVSTREPARLWKRYVLLNPAYLVCSRCKQFVWLLLNHRVVNTDARADAVWLNLV